MIAQWQAIGTAIEECASGASGRWSARVAPNVLQGAPSMDAIYEKLGERIVQAARTAAAIHQELASHSFRQATQVSGTDLGRVMEDAAVSDALVDDRPAGPHVQGYALRRPHRRAGRSPRPSRYHRGN
jgi:hypothetical protein